MTDPLSDPSASRRRGAHRHHQRRQTRNRVIAVALATVLVAFGALWFSDTLRIPTDGPSFAGGAVTRTPTDTPTAPGSVKPANRAINPLQPMRLWIGGDSLAGALGPSLGQMTAATGVVQPQYDSRVGSGLMSGVGDINWMQHAQQQMTELNPEVVVFVIGTNDANVYNDSQAALYAQLTEQMMRILVGNGREVYWVNAPVMRESRLEKNVVKVDAIQREVALKIPQVTFVDAHTLFADETGAYRSSLPNSVGLRVTMRAGDGIHLTADGADHLAEAIFKQLDQSWRITQQTVVGQAKKVIVSRGSTQVSGSGSSSSGSSSQSYRSSRSSRSTSSGNAGTTSSTPAATAPPSPPATPATQATTPKTPITTPSGPPTP